MYNQLLTACNLKCFLETDSSREGEMFRKICKARTAIHLTYKIELLPRHSVPQSFYKKQTLLFTVPKLSVDSCSHR